MDIDSSIGNAVTQEMARSLVECELKMHALQDIVKQYRKKLSLQAHTIKRMKLEISQLRKDK